MDQHPTSSTDDRSSAPRAAASARCRTCDRELTPEAPHAPFCSMRCRQADLGRWFNGEYAISRPIEESDLLDPE
jgi:endogenous inhibitor of DNA gyrase (YacG/DUF329 family)